MKYKDRSILFALALLGAIGSAPVRATKPCPPEPCHDSAGRFDRHECESSADWIAQGTITNVQHHREGSPLDKDFAEFGFTVLRWEKKPQAAASKFRFKVGWCENSQELPASTTGLFRIFGLASRAEAANESRYLHIERISDSAVP